MLLNAAKALIFRITHIDNVHWDMQHGLQCRSSRTVNPGYTNIGNLDLIAARNEWPVPIPPGGSLSDYVPFYFTPRSPMLFNIKTGYNVPAVPMENIVIYVSSLRRLAARGRSFVFTDRHAKLATAKFSSDLNELEAIDWRILQNSDFQRNPADPGKMERYQAEALVHRQLPCEMLSAILCYNNEANSYVTEAVSRQNISVRILTKANLYF